MKTQKILWTQQQRQAIETLDKDVMVAASAGTGKTAVLSQRCAQITQNLTENHKNADVSQLLVLTFTEAAAEEMQHRIASAVFKSYYQNQNRKELKEQVLLLDAADICTIHSFCKKIISENFYILGIDPDFAIIDEDEQILLKNQALEEIIEQAWNEPDLSEKIENLLYLRDTQGGKTFAKNIITVSDKLKGLADTDKWFEQAEKIANEMFDTKGKIFAKQKQLILEQIEQMFQMLGESGILDNKIADSLAFPKVRSQVFQDISQLKKFIDDNNLASFSDYINSYKFPQMRCEIKKFEKEQSEIIKSPLAKIKNAIEQLQKLFYCDCQYEQMIANYSGADEKIFIELLKRFDCRYKELKNNLNSMDFNDLEHYALTLLKQGGEPSAAANELSDKYKYILVDEYQDISGIQQAIINLISKSNNLFGVGDIKQSIYAFRQANPEIFLAMLKNNNENLIIDLNTNFRSRPDILEFVNIIFSSIMQRKTSQMDYDKSCYLSGGQDYNGKNKSESNPSIELFILDEKTQDQSDNEYDDDQHTADELSTVSRQAATAANKIKDIVEVKKLNIFDNKTKSLRPIKYSDIAILMRSPSKRINDYAEVLGLYGIPLANTANSGYFETTEITDCLCFLKILDNYRQDIELACLMRSPFFNFNDNQLAKIKLFSKDLDCDFFTAVNNYSDIADENLCRKCRTFIDELNYWRTQSAQMNIADLIWSIYRNTNYLSFAASQKNGKQRKANLIRLHERAIQFENFASSKISAGLTRFINFIEELLQQGGDWAEAQTELTEQDGVIITSIHKSKGLEYPVVILVGLEKKFNIQDTTQACLFDEDNGIGLKILKKSDNSWIQTPSRDVIKEKIIQQTKAEEMRILYVALTRAREKLVLIGSKEIKNIQNIFEPVNILADEPLSSWRVNNCNNFLDWLIIAMARNPKTASIIKSALKISQAGDSFFGVQIFQSDKISQIDKDFESAKKLPNFSSAIPNLSDIVVQLNPQYPHQKATTTQGKQTVSAIAKASQDTQGSIFYDDFAIINRMNKAQNNAAERGTAIHLIFQQIPLNKVINTENIDNLISSLTKQNLINPDILNPEDSQKVASFFNTEIATLIFNTDNQVFREWQFTYALAQPEIDEKIILQGVIDMLILTHEGITVIDYKTDKISAEQIPSQTEKYRKQLDLYAQAASEILNKPITAKYLYFLEPQQLHQL